MDADRRKLLIIVDTNVGGKGGAETHLWNLLNTLDKSRVSVEVMYFDCDEVDKINPRKPPAGVTFHYVPLRKIYSPFSLKYLIEIFRIMRVGRYDCAISLFESSDIVTALFGKLAGIKTRISNRRDTGFRSSNKIKLAYRVINTGFTDFIAVSSAVKESIIEQGVVPEKIKLIYNSVDTKRFENANPAKIKTELNIPDQALVFTMVANLNPVKNHKSVINALTKLHEKFPEAHLVLAGQGQLEDDLKSQTQQLGLEKYVHFLGARNDIVDILAAADVFILASFTEGLSNSLLEAMASKTAVIASRVGGNIEVIEHEVTGKLVDTDADSIATAMLALAGSPELRASFTQAAFNRVEEIFSVQTMLKSYMSLINKEPSLDMLSKTHTRSGA